MRLSRLFFISRSMVPLATAFLFLLATSCSSDPESEGSDTNPSTEREKDTTAANIPADGNPEELILGTWEILSVNGQDVTENPDYTGIRTAYQKEGVMFRARRYKDEGDPYWGVDGGMWSIDREKRLLTTVVLPDSTINQTRLLDVSRDRLTLQGLKTGRVFIWQRSSDDIESLSGE